MKKNKIILVLSMLIVALSSCSDDFLDRYPEEELSDASFWKLPSDAEQFIAQNYRAFPNMGMADDARSDNAVHGTPWYASPIDIGLYDPANSSWSSEYSYIRICNILLEKIDLIPDYPTADKEIVIAEARFFRAYQYFILIRKFGDVPYTESSLLMSELGDITRTSKDEIYKKVMEDFEYATSKLPSTWPAEKYGRVTKWAAHSMQAKAALYFKDWETAVRESNEVIKSNQFELFDKDNTGRYAELFFERAEQEVAATEAILVRVCHPLNALEWTIGYSGYMSAGGWGGINPTQSLVDAFEDIDGSPITESKKYDPKDPFANRDPRLEINIVHHGEGVYKDADGELIICKTARLPSSGIDYTHAIASQTGYYQQKYLDPEFDILGDFWKGGRDWPVIRFTEVLLMYAEAKNELSALDATAFEAVNRVRSRVGMPILQNSNANLPTYCSSQDELRQRIRNEKRVEFAGEGSDRQWDVRRWGIATDVLNKPYYGMAYKLVDSPDALEGDGGKICILYGDGTPIELPGSQYSDHNYVHPIPQSERDLNPALTQNPGY